MVLYKIISEEISWGMCILLRGKKIKELLAYNSFWLMIIDCFFESYIYDWIEIVRKYFIKIPYSRWG